MTGIMDCELTNATNNGLAELLRELKQVAIDTNKEWAKADEIRAKLDTMGVVLEDTQSGTIWKRK